MPLLKNISHLQKKEGDGEDSLLLTSLAQPSSQNKPAMNQQNQPELISPLWK